MKNNDALKMKYILYCVIIIILIFLVLLFFRFRNTGDPISPPEGLNAELTDLSTSGGVLQEENTGDDSWYHEAEYTIERKGFGGWKALPENSEINLAWPDLLYYINPGERKTEQLNWEYRYGKLETGNYRLLREVWQEDKLRKQLVVYFEIP